MAGIQPRADEKIELFPIDMEWDHFLVNNARYHGHDLTVCYDEIGDGTRYYEDLPEGYSLRIGFDIKQTSANYPLSVVAEGDIYPSYFYQPNAKKWFKSPISSDGNLSVQCIVESDLYPDYLIENKSLYASTFVKAGEDVDFYFQTRNHGTMDVPAGACTYDVAIDGNKVATMSNATAFAANFIYLQGSVTSQGLAAGAHTLTISTATINGEPVENPNSTSYVFKVYEHGFAHQMHLVEQFTSTYCMWCPLGIGLLKRLVNHGHNIHQMRPGCQFRHHTAPLLVHFLACYHAGKQILVFQHGG
jgi:hypothetical protein